MKYLFHGASIQNSRQSNMDSLLLKKRKIGVCTALIAVVCDGVGSLKDGAYASGLAVHMLNEWFSETSSTESVGLRMRDAVLNINSHIQSESKTVNIETASTLSALLLVEDQYFIVHIGDSRVYCYEDGLLTILTHDDISESGKLTACIGHSDEVFLQYSEGSAQGKTFLVCSDGLYKRMETDFLIAKMRSLDRRSLHETVKSLPLHSIEYGEQDNISLALVKILV